MAGASLLGIAPTPKASAVHPDLVTESEAGGLGAELSIPLANWVRLSSGEAGSTPRHTVRMKAKSWKVTALLWMELAGSVAASA